MNSYVILAILFGGPLGIPFEEVLAHHALAFEDHLLDDHSAHPREVHVAESLKISALRLRHLAALRGAPILGGGGRAEGVAFGRGGSEEGLVSFGLEEGLVSFGLEEGLVSFGLDVPKLFVVKDLFIEFVLLDAAQVQLLVEELDALVLNHSPLAGLAAFAVDRAFLLSDELNYEGFTQ